MQYALLTSKWKDRASRRDDCDFYPPHSGSIRGFFFVGYFIKYGQYRSIKVNHSQLRLIKVN